MKGILLSFGLVFSITTAALASSSINNVIIFGDSLSDGGNLPEVSQPFINPAAPKTVANTDPEFYVPITNPVDTASTTATPPGLGISTSYAWPNLDAAYLSPQAPINQQQRLFHSISWPQFFVSYAHQEQLLASHTIVPSYLLADHSYNSNISVNYAWGYALSTPGCADENYQPVSNCTADSINQARAHFVANPTKANRSQLIIPGAPEQVSLFLQDVQQHKVAVNKSTMYVFWIGGNDLIVANEQLQQGHLGDAFWYMLGGPADHTIAAIRHLVTQLKDQAPKKVYVFNLIDPGLTPEYYNTNLAKLGNFIVSSYNFWLNVKVSAFNLLSPTKIHVVPVYDWYQQASQSDYFKANLGKACQIAGGDYTHAQSIPQHNCAGFMFWNGVHPASPIHMQTAYKLMQAVKKHQDLTPKLSLRDYQLEHKRLNTIKSSLSVKE